MLFHIHSTHEINVASQAMPYMKRALKEYIYKLGWCALILLGVYSLGCWVTPIFFVVHLLSLVLFYFILTKIWKDLSEKSQLFTLSALM